MFSNILKPQRALTKYCFYLDRSKTLETVL